MKLLSKLFLGVLLLFICANRVWAQNETAEISERITDSLNTPNTEITKIIASNPNFGSVFGTSVGIDGDTLVVGAPGDLDSSDVQRGAIYVFTRDGSSWIQQARIISPAAAPNSDFGVSVAISGDRIIVGARSESLTNDNNRQGAAYIFVRQNGNWTYEQKLVASDPAPASGYGASVAIKGNLAVVGAYLASVDGINSGSAYVYAESGGLWTQQTRLVDAMRTGFDQFGVSVEIDGGRIVVGASYGKIPGQVDRVGIVCVFAGSGANWTQQARINSSDATLNGTFGISVDLEGDTLAVGASGQRAIYIFARSGNDWIQQQKLINPIATEAFFFGAKISLSNNTLMVGSTGEYTGATNPGAAHVFTRNGNLWVHQARLTPSDGAAGNNFGNSVAVSGTNLMVGSPGNRTTVINQGAVYYFFSPLAAPDLQSGSDNGISSSDNITNSPNLSFDIRNVTAGAVVELLRNGIVVDSKIAASGLNILVDSGIPNEQGNYSYSTRQTVNGVRGSTSETVIVTHDTAPPVVAVNQHPFQNDPTPLGGASFTVEFSEPVFGFSESDISFSGSTVDLTNSVFYLDTQPNPLLFFLRVNNVVGNNQILVAGVPAGALTDVAGNFNANSVSDDNTVTIDNVSPTAVINQAVGQIDPTANLPINFTVTFSEPVTDFDDVSDITLNGSTANTSSAVINITGSGTTYNVAVSNITSNGQTVRAAVQPNAAQDALGNFSGFSTSTDNTVVVDNVRPAVTVNQATGQSDPTSIQPVNFRVVFSESVTGFDAADISFTGSTANVSGASVSITGSGTTYNIAVGSITSSGIVRATVAANSVQDALGNLNTASTSTDNTIAFNMKKAFYDFDGDGKADVSVFRPDNGTWYLLQSSAGFTGLAFGVSTDKLAPADYDGDGKTDVAVVRNGVWYLQRSQLGFTGIQFGDGNDVPVPADYDGDGKAELAVFRPSNGYWYLLNLTNNQFTATPFGISTDRPVPADYDGDGKTDIAVNRNGNWYLQRSQLGFTGILFGDGNDKTVPADYDGDGKADIAVFRPSNGTWYLLQSAAGFTGLAFGLGTDIPVAADYDGDGKADIAVVRNGNWYLNRTTQGFTGIPFGTATDKPIPNAFVR